MLLKKLINNYYIKRKNIKVTGLSINSKDIKKGYIFFAIKGNRSNGEKFIDEAVKKGAQVIVCSKQCKYTNSKITVIKSSNIRYLLSEITSKFYRLKPKNIIAVTGTNGKTSVADLFYQILNINKVPVASIGTLGIKYKGKKIKSNLTTPDTISIHKNLEKLKKNKIDNVIIEASSHGLVQKRLDHLNFKAAIFTNFSQDHLDYHNTMKSYLNAKLLLFNKIISKNKKVISDNSLKEYPILKKISKMRKLHLFDISFLFKKLEKKYKSKFSLFQLKNLSMAILAAQICGLKEKKIFSTIKKLKDVEGRLEMIKKFSGNIKVFVDFAHTPDALIKSINSLKRLYGNNISIVFGCGGDRDYKKRPLMAKIVSSNCKKIYVTDDNPRNEDPNKIRKQIVNHIKNKNHFNIGNRSKAIRHAIQNASPNEIILISGKGHETEQIYKNRTLSISDKKIIQNFRFNSRMSLNNQNYSQNKKILQEFNWKLKTNSFHGISIDSRLIKKNNLFLTIKGKNNNGAEFASKAIRKGAKYIITSQAIRRPKKKIIKVKNEIKFLNYYASRKRDLTSARIIAVTGSAGKTSLKNLIRDLLNNFGKTLCSPKSYNNHFGVPLSLSQLHIKHDFGVFEVGMNKAGEINTLTKIIKPHIGIITNIGEAHIENFQNQRGIADAKGEIMNNIQKDGTIILNRDDKYFNYLQKKAKLKNLKVTTYGRSKKSDVNLISESKNGDEIKLKIKIRSQILKIKIKNINIYNVLSSLALLKELNLDLKMIKNHYKNYSATDGRGKIHNIKRYRKNFNLIDESYNANPLSVKTAIDNFKLIKKRNFKKYLLLGDMLELGKKSDILHKNLSKVINNSDIDKVFIKGNKSLITYKNIDKNKRGNIFQLEEDVDFTFNSIISNNDYLMIKGSNATGLNNLSQKMIKGY